MKKNRLIYAIFIAAILSNAFADTVYLKNGRQLTGIITGEFQDKIIIDTGINEIRISAEQIERIEKLDYIDNKLHEVKTFLENGKVILALKEYIEMLSYVSDDFPKDEIYKRARAHLVDNSQLFISKVSETKPAEIKPLLTEFLTALQKNEELKNSDNSAVNYIAMECFFIIKDLDNSLKSFLEIPIEYSMIPQEKKNIMIMLLKEKIKNLLAKDNFEEALGYIESINRINPLAGHSCQALIYLDWGRKERNNGNFEEALRIYFEELKPISPNIAEERIKTTLDNIRQDALDEGNFDLAIKLWESYGNPLFPDAAMEALSQLNFEKGKTLFSRKNYKAAKKCFLNSDTYQKSATAEKEAARCDYQITLELAPPNTPETHYRLAEFCLDKKLNNEAIEQFSLAAKSPELKIAATQQIDLIKEKEQVEIFKEAMRLYEEKNYVKTLDKIFELLNRYPETTMKAEANVMKDLCQKNIQSENYKHIYQADVLYQEAERLFFLGEYLKSVDKCDTILTEFADTPASIKANALKPKIRYYLAMNTFEASGIYTNPSDIDSTTVINLHTDDIELEKELKNLLGIFEPKTNQKE